MSYPKSRFFERMGVESNQLHETPKAHAAFLIYCTMEGRTLEKVRQALGAKPSYLGLLKTWSVKYGWVERVKAYDREAKEEELRAQEKAVRQMNERHSLTSTTTQVTVLEYLLWQIKSKKLGSIAAVALYKNLIDWERVSRGATTENAKLELTGPAGGPIESNTYVRVYLPEKDPLPPSANIVSSEQSEQAPPPSLPESAESLKRRLAEQIAAYLQRDGA